jgi:ABC-type nitrate/sulfonate/bicarbonate transport system substrate-binding protein
MGLNTRSDVLESSRDTAVKLVRALIKANQWVLASPGSKVVAAAPPEIVSGGHVQLLANAIDKYKKDLYPADGKLDVNAVQRVIDVQQTSGALQTSSPFDAADLFTNSLIPG